MLGYDQLRKESGIENKFKMFFNFIKKRKKTNFGSIVYI